MPSSMMMVAVIAVSLVALAQSAAVVVPIVVPTPALRYVSGTKWNLTSAAAGGLTLATMVANDISSVVACIASLPKGTVKGGFAGTAVNQNFVNCSSVSEWGSYVKVIDFKDYASQQLYEACPAFLLPIYTVNTQYRLEKAHFAATVTAAVSALGFPAAALYHVSMANATAGPDATSIAAVVTARQTLNSAVAGMANTNIVSTWTPAYAGSSPFTMVTILGWTSNQSGVAYKAYKNGNAPGPVGALPLYIAIKLIATSSRDSEVVPIFLAGN